MIGYVFPLQRSVVRYPYMIQDVSTTVRVGGVHPYSATATLEANQGDDFRITIANEGNFPVSFIFSQHEGLRDIYRNRVVQPTGNHPLVLEVKDQPAGTYSLYLQCFTLSFRECSSAWAQIEVLRMNMEVDHWRM